MSRLFSRLFAVISLSTLATVVSCGGGSSSDKAQLRVLHAAVNEPSEDVLVDSTVVSTSLGYSANTGYLSVNPGSRHVQVEPSGTSSPIFDQTLTMNAS